MCLIVFSYDRHPEYSLILGANRDEFYERPTVPARFWAQAPHVLAGRDETAGGTWMGVTRTGRWAAVTNVRDPGAHDPSAPSRGHLVSEYLTDEPDPRAYLNDLSHRAASYNGFNLLVGAPEGIWYLSNYAGNDDRTAAGRRVDPGLHGLSNHLLDTPWPKVEHAKDQLAALSVRADEQVEVGGHPTAENPTATNDTATNDTAPPENNRSPQAGDLRSPDDANDPVDLVLDLLDNREPFPEDRLPDTGVGREKERMLSPLFIESDVYGTRSSTVLLIRRDGRITFAERTYQRGTAGATRRFSFALPSVSETEAG